MSVGMIILIIIISALVVFVSYIVANTIYQRRVEIVKTTSDRYKRRITIDRSYRAKFIRYKNEYTYTHEVKTRKQVDNFNFEASLTDNLRHNAPCDANKIIRYDKRNREIVSAYREQLRNLPPLQTQQQLDSKGIKMSLAHYRNIEGQLFDIPELSPILGLFITVCVSYTSLAGRSHYERKQTFSIEGIKRILDDMQTEEYRKNAQKRERALMSNKLRYEILQRDGFRCVLCGASQADGAELEVDHIVPVAKGGKTEPSNLRTLCFNCNRGKLDTYSDTKIN